MILNVSKTFDNAQDGAIDDRKVLILYRFSIQYRSTTINI